MRPIPEQLRRQMEADPQMKMCIHFNKDCQDQFGNRPARAEWEHAFEYAGRQINEWWAIIGVCWYHHQGPGLNKDYNRYRCLIRMTDKDIEEAQKKYPKRNWRELRDRLIIKFEKNGT
jgi:hypothetical protein